MSSEENLSSKEKQSLDDVFQPKDFSTYFQSQPRVQKLSALTSKYFSGKVLEGVDALIYMGSLDVSQIPKTVEELMDQAKVNQEEQRAIQMKIRKQEIEEQLEYLKKQTSIVRSSSEDRLIQNKIVLSKEEHKRVVSRLKKNRMERDRNHSAFVSKLQRKIQESAQQQKQQRQQRLQSELRLRRQAIEVSMQRNKKRKDQNLNIEKESKQKLKGIINNPFVYQQIQQKYHKTIVLPQLEEKKRKLKQIRDYKAFNIEQLNDHQRSYLQQKQLAASRRSEIKEDWNYKPPPKSQRLEVILEEEKIKRQEKLEQKKRQAEERVTRQQTFLAKLRDHFTPTIDPVKEQQIRNRIQKSRVVKPEPAADLKEIGMNYLDFARKNRKIAKRNLQQRPQTEREVTNKTIQTIRDTSTKPQSINYLTVKPKDEHYYQRKRRRHIEKLIKKEDLPQQQRIKGLKMQTSKIDQKLQQKQREYKHTGDSKLKQDTLQLLLSSIQAKIGIIQISQQ